MTVKKLKNQWPSEWLSITGSQRSNVQRPLLCSTTVTDRDDCVQ